MKDLFRQYIVNLYQDIPQEVYEVFLFVFCVGLVTFIICKGLKTGIRYSAALLLIEYFFLLLCSTVVYRTIGETKQYYLRPLWSYMAIEEGRVELLPENIMNIVVFIPVGLLLDVVIKKMTWWKALLIGCGISVSIEALQFFLMRGLAELDDVMHNTLGCLIGFGIMMKVKLLFKTRYKNV